MYPDLSYLLHDLIGTDVDNWTSIFKTFGLLLACVFLVSAWYVKAELKRKEEEGLLMATTKTIETKGGFDYKEIIYNSIVFGLLGLKVPYIYANFAEFQQDPASVLISGKGNWVIGSLLFLGMAGYSYYTQKKEDRKAGTKTVVIHPHERTGDIIMTSAISGVFGAKVFSILENLDAFFADPIGQLISGSGLTIYGGLIFGAIAVLYLVNKIGIKPVHMLDIGGPTILLGYAVGRMGCQLSGDGDWGIVAAAQPEWWFFPEWLWSYTFPNNVNNAGGLIAGCDPEAYRSVAGNIAVEARCQAACGMRYCHELKEGVYPTSIYEILISFSGLIVLWFWRRKIKIGGMVFSLYLIFNGFERFFIETIRVNERYDYLGLDWSQAQFISVGFILVGVIGALYLWKYGTRYNVKPTEVKEN
ncbi:MAG: phosphatidylglycerol:prolipoprotein diacylglycerol transferase [Saprospiraceae bacterium]|jgi:phosphatidylglycerol:prolipoprotein diacylglycerol transferase